MTEKKESATVLPDDVHIVDSDSIEICVVQNISGMIHQIMQMLGVTQAQLQRHIEPYGQATACLSMTVLALIQAAGGDFSKPMPSPAEFKRILESIATQNAYSVEYEPTEKANW